jgi:RNA polymerase sigma factor (sigma-70 family)
MARLQRGDDPKIDKINDLVAIVKGCGSSSEEYSNAIEELLQMFKPMLIKVCNKWCQYFNDSSHLYVPWNSLLSDAEYWFIRYTKEKYVIDGDATYNKFIKDHIDQRIRYIYECSIKYYNQNIFPDPDKNHDNDGGDEFEMVAYNYSSQLSDNSTMEDDIIDDAVANIRNRLARRIVEIVSNSRGFNEREKLIFIEIMYNGVTQDEMSKRLGISRTRVVQILKKIKYKLKTEMENDNEFWELITQTDIEFDKNYL